MSEHPPRAVRPDHVEPDPRTDGVGDGGRRELPAPATEEIAAGVVHDQEVHQPRALAGYDEDR